MSATRGPRDPFLPTALAAPWLAHRRPPTADADAIRTALADLRRAVVIVRTDAGPAVADGGSVAWCGTEGLPVLAVLPPLHPSALGDPAFRADHGLRFAYVTGAMANGIASAELVEAVGGGGGVALFWAPGGSLGPAPGPPPPGQ